MSRKIANLRSTKNGIRCDRVSALGNPFYMQTEAERDAVCDAYKTYFDLVVGHKLEPYLAVPKVLEMHRVKLSRAWVTPTRATFRQTLDQIKRNLNEPLLCWCTPKRCHCETISEWLDQEVEK